MYTEEPFRGAGITRLNKQPLNTRTMSASQKTFRGAGITRQQTTFDYADNVRSPETFYDYPPVPLRRLYSPVAAFPVHGADFAVLFVKLKRVDHAEFFVDVSAKGEVVNRFVSDDAVFVD